MCRVLRGGEVGSRKSIALEQVEVPSPTLTPEDLENLKVAEIAEQMHESVSSIKSKLMRARKYLRKELEDSVL